MRADYHTYFVGCDEWGFSVWAHDTCFEYRPYKGQLTLFEVGAQKPYQHNPLTGNPGEVVFSNEFAAQDYLFVANHPKVQGSTLLSRIPKDEQTAAMMTTKPSRAQVESNYAKYTNPGEHDASTTQNLMPYVKGKSTLPSNHLQLFEQCRPMPPDANGRIIRWAIEDTRNGQVLHRFQETGKGSGVFHWNGQSANGFDDAGNVRNLLPSQLPTKAERLELFGK